jgi:glycerophosphoryl diester phosphodiesterase
MKPRSSVIAHRGASGYLPEHTSEAKVLAHAMGADYIEQDVVATRDSKLIVMHDIALDDVTDVAEVFPGRARADGRHYAIDFDLEEIRELRVVERRRSGTDEPLYSGRFRADDARFHVSTLAEEIALIQGLNTTSGRQAGICPEIKEPRWHLEHDVDLADLVLRELDRHGYRDSESRIYLQCFDSRELQRMRAELGTRLKLLQLLPASDAVSPTLTPETFAPIADYATAVGLPYELLIDRSQGGRAPGLRASSLLSIVRNVGLAVFAYTLRRDRVPEWAPSFEGLLHFLFAELSDGGLFCDHPDIAVRTRNSLSS